jgi:Tfp pilus assembly protein PilF
VQNLLLHCANAVLVYVVSRRVMGLAASANGESNADRFVVPSAVAALVFAIHPLRVESVAWNTERRDMLSLLFCLTSVLCYLRFTRESERSTRWYLLSLVAFVCAVLSKATSVSLPVVLLVLNVYPLRRIRAASGWTNATARHVWFELVPFAVIAGATAVLSIVALDPPAQLPLGAKLAVSAHSLTFYLHKTLVPRGLAPLYEMPKSIDPAAVRYVVSYAVVVAVSVLAWAVRRRHPAVTTAWVVFLVVLFPMLGIVQNGPQIAADRYTYHAAPALAILVGGAVMAWRGTPWLRASVVSGGLALLAVLTWRQTAIWHDSERLWARVLVVDSTSSIAQIAMGDVLISQDRIDEAAQHYERGVELDPTFAIGFNNLGVVLARQGKLAEATQRYARAIELRPTYADAHNNWGIVLSQQGDFPGAIEHFERAIALDPRNADAEVNLGNSFVRQRQPGAAVEHYARAAAIRPNDANAYLNWGVALAQLGRMADAADQFRRVLAIQPDNADARAYLERATR